MLLLRSFFVHELHELSEFGLASPIIFTSLICIIRIIRQIRGLTFFAIFFFTRCSILQRHAAAEALA